MEDFYFFPGGGEGKRKVVIGVGPRSNSINIVIRS